MRPLKSPSDNSKPMRGSEAYYKSQGKIWVVLGIALAIGNVWMAQTSGVYYWLGSYAGSLGVTMGVWFLMGGPRRMDQSKSPWRITIVKYGLLGWFFFIVGIAVGLWLDHLINSGAAKLGL